jgi:asparagine synthase (glutamine-hydrolysing)
MMQKMKHRGPNDEGIFLDGNIGFGFLRLSILDLSLLGHQPMFDESKKFMIIHNGEVYNYLELRNELEKKGYKFKSNTDTEVILYSFIEWGENCLNKFNGMWAFAIYDKEEKVLFISRDRYGVKPLYYYIDNQKFIFASEIPAILEVINHKPQANFQAIFDYLVFNRTDHTEDTFFTSIKRLKHGYCIKFTSNEFQKIDKNGWKEFLPRVYMKKWYDLREKVYQAKGFNSPEEFREIFRSAIALRLRSDVPVGVCLSGGLDSSSIVSILLHDFQKKDLHTFSAVYTKGQLGDESEFINEFQPLIQNMHFTTPSAETLFNDLHNFVKAHAEPVPSTSPYAQFKVMELAKDHIVVALNGQGADEELAGYHYFFGLFFKDLLHNAKIIRLSSEIFHYLKNYRSIYGLKTFFFFLLPANLRTKVRILEKGYLNPNFANEFASNNHVADTIYASKTLTDALIDHFEYKLEHLLKWEDRNSMWFSLESRVPFLDYRLVENILAMDGTEKIRNGMTKFILRESMKGILPEKIRLRRDKVGFGTPEGLWFKLPMFQKMIKDLLYSNEFKKRGIIDNNKAIKLYEKYLQNKINISSDIWKWINLEFWFRKFID